MILFLDVMGIRSKWIKRNSLRLRSDIACESLFFPSDHSNLGNHIKNLRGPRLIRYIKCLEQTVQKQHICRIMALSKKYLDSSVV
jgi:hypothetical protein